MVFFLAFFDFLEPSVLRLAAKIFLESALFDLFFELGLLLTRLALLLRDLDWLLFRSCEGDLRITCEFDFVLVMLRPKLFQIVTKFL